MATSTETSAWFAEPELEIEFVRAVRPSDEEMERIERLRAEDELPIERAWREAEAANDRGDPEPLRKLIQADRSDNLYAVRADRLARRHAPPPCVRRLVVGRARGRGTRARAHRSRASRRGPPRRSDDPEPPLGAHQGRATATFVASRERLAAKVSS